MNVNAQAVHSVSFSAFRSQPAVRPSAASLGSFPSYGTVFSSWPKWRPWRNGKYHVHCWSASRPTLVCGIWATKWSTDSSRSSFKVGRGLLITCHLFCLFVLQFLLLVNGKGTPKKKKILLPSSICIFFTKWSCLINIWITLGQDKIFPVSSVQEHFLAPETVTVR